MAPKKTVSHEEKLKLLCSWFQSTHDFYTLKEIEQKASKACKIPGMQVKELVSNLVDDGLIQQEKSGTTNLYWSFIYTDKKTKIDRAKRLKHDLESKKKQREQLKQEMQALQVERSVEAVPERVSQLRELGSIQAEINQLMEQNNHLQRHKEIEKLQAGIEFFADSIEIMLSWLSEQSGIKQSELRKEMGIPVDLEEYALNPT
ncbi:MND1 [Candida theae]|uniref:Meiotic nuclear division protein 1 n=1 Tax=Candida theae TaxID=1198502 RepID=A0AAD5BFQ6_9ASCO|nr:MND1 [Candida theae]KAI5958856.1 MND1 [Candida theae]